MSISTTSFYTTACPSSGEGMPSEATPHSVGSVYIANGRQHVKQDSTIVQDAWANELRHRVHLVDESLDWYLDHLVPCAQSYLPSIDLKSKPGPFAQYQPKAGGEVASYPGLVRGRPIYC